MSATQSMMTPLGAKAPDFNLYDTISGKSIGLKDITSDKATVVMFICNHCPYVILINEALVKLANEYINRGVSFVAISSNNVINYPEDGPEEMKKTALKLAYPFPYLYDETQEVAKLYNAQCTPDLFVYDKQLKLTYRGQFDSARPNNGIQPNGRDLRNALDNMLAGKPVPDKQIPSIGCNIKWK